jgi:hypothetical protein
MSSRHSLGERLAAPCTSIAEVTARDLLLAELLAQALHLGAGPDLLEGLVVEIAENERGVGVTATWHDAAVPEHDDGSPRVAAQIAHGRCARLTGLGIGTIEIFDVRAYEWQACAAPAREETLTLVPVFHQIDHLDDDGGRIRTACRVREQRIEVAFRPVVTRGGPPDRDGGLVVDPVERNHDTPQSCVDDAGAEIALQHRRIARHLRRQPAP